MTSIAPGAPVPLVSSAPRVLRSTSWDRWFVAGGAWLVPVPIVAFYLFRQLGCTVAAAEDLVTLLVMVPLGGPHVFATYTRTYLNPAFRRQDPLLFVLGLCVPVVVIGAAVSSAFFDVVIAGSPPIRYVLTFFFFWAGVHIVHQHSYIASGYVDGRGTRWGWVDYAVMLLAMYPVSLFRMSMLDRSDATMRAADPDALATRIVTAVAGSREAADDYVFRIGRVAPILPDFLMHPAMWIGVGVAFVVATLLFVWKSVREHRAGTLVAQRFWLVVAMIGFGATVPLLPNLDSAFQGMNAWHSFQYLGLAWLMNQRSAKQGEIRYPLFDRVSRDGAHWRFYQAALVGTVGALATVLVLASVIAATSGGQFAMFGHDEPLRDAAGRELYRPGAVLLSYYLLVFSVLLVHYLHDGFFFCRRRYLRDA